jgi:hypothetical protein
VSESERVTVLLVPKAVEALHRSAQREEMQRTDIINRALQMYDMIMEQVISSGETRIRIGKAGWDIKGIL